MTACPNYASVGCFTGAGVHYDLQNNALIEVYKGCSSFEIPNGISMFDVEVSGQSE